MHKPTRDLDVIANINKLETLSFYYLPEEINSRVDDNIAYTADITVTQEEPGFSV